MWPEATSHLGRDGFELVKQGLHTTGAQAQFFHERGHLAATARQTKLQLVDGSLREASRAGQFLPIFAVLIEQCSDRLEVDRNAGGDFLFRIRLIRGDLHGAVEGQFATVDQTQCLDRLFHAVIVFEDLAAEDHARKLNLLGETDFLIPREQADFTHLRQVHAHRIVDTAGLRLIDCLGQSARDRGFFRQIRNDHDLWLGLLVFLEGDLRFGRVPHRTGIDQCDAFSDITHQQLVDHVRLDPLVRQVLVELVVGEVALLFAELFQLDHFWMDLSVHCALLPRGSQRVAYDRGTQPGFL